MNAIVIVVIAAGQRGQLFTVDRAVLVVGGRGCRVGRHRKSGGTRAYP